MHVKLFLACNNGPATAASFTDLWGAKYQWNTVFHFSPTLSLSYLHLSFKGFWDTYGNFQNFICNKKFGALFWDIFIASALLQMAGQCVLKISNTMAIVKKNWYAVLYYNFTKRGSPPIVDRIKYILSYSRTKFQD